MDKRMWVFFLVTAACLMLAVSVAIPARLVITKNWKDLHFEIDLKRPTQ
jgi:hypothetical protein